MGSIQMTSKIRAYLRSQAQLLEATVQIGKEGVAPEVTEQVSEALEARELVKVNVQRNCLEDVKEIAQTLSERTRSDVVQVIGRKIVLYRPAKEPKIVLPKIAKKAKPDD